MSLINKHYNDCYFSEENGYLESRYVFIDGNSIEPREKITIGETGFGSGLNLLVLEDFIEASGVGGIELEFISIEKYPLSLEDVLQGINSFKEISSSSLDRHKELYKKVIDSLEPGWNYWEFYRSWGSLKLQLFYGDVMDSFISFPGYVDHWFLDGHSPDKNPEMWSSSLFEKVAHNSRKGTTFATFTSAGVVKRGLREAGFFVKRKKGFGKKRHMIIGML